MRTLVLATIIATPWIANSLPAQALWSQLQPAATPGPRAGAAAVYDPVTRKILLFGGGDGRNLLGGTWQWDGSNWTQLTSLTSPSPRGLPGLVYDPVRDRIILFGGGTTSGMSAETWEWLRGDWKLLTPTTSPPARTDFVMFFDPISSRIVICGGEGSIPFQGLSDTWAWNGTTWQQLFPSVSPTIGPTESSARDPKTGRTLVFGGAEYSNGWQAHNDTWAWTGEDWQKLTPNTVPPGRWDSCMFTDELSHRMFMFGGGAHGTAFNDMWEWDGQDWNQMSISTVSSPRGSSASAYDSQRGRLFLYGGSGGPITGDTWEWASNLLAAYVFTAPGCTGSISGIPSLTSTTLPMLGQGFTIGVSNAPPITAGALFFSATPANFSLAVIGAPGCTAYANGHVILPFATDFNGTWFNPPTIPIPNDPGLAGGMFWNQAFLVDHAANRLGVIVSNGAQATVGY